MKILCVHCHGTGLIDATELSPVRGKPSLQMRIICAINESKSGITAPQLIEAVYSDDEDGGPLHPLMTIHRTIYKINERLVGYRIKANKLGRGARYRLEKL